MSRVLVTGGAGMLGAALVRRLLADPAYEVRVADERPVPQWMREGAELHDGPLGDAGNIRDALVGCTHVVNLAADGAGSGVEPFTAMAHAGASTSAALAASCEAGVERFVQVSSALVFERADTFPTPEQALYAAPVPRAPVALAALASETLVRAAHEQHGLTFTICRAADPYGPAERAEARGSEVLELVASVSANDGTGPVRCAAEHLRTPTHVDDLASGIVAALSAASAENDDFNLAWAHELELAQVVRIAWEALGREKKTLELEPAEPSPQDPLRRWPSAEKARDRLGWEAQIAPADGIGAVARSIGCRT